MDVLDNSVSAFQSRLKASPTWTNYITMKVRPFCEVSGLCRSTVNSLFKSGKIKSVKCGGARLIIIQSYLDFLERGAELEEERRAKAKTDHPAAA